MKIKTFIGYGCLFYPALLFIFIWQVTGSKELLQHAAITFVAGIGAWFYLIYDDPVKVSEKKYGKYDYLTGLYNEYSFELLVKQRTKKRDLKGIFIYFDLDNFKKINDTQGHSAGDKCIKQFAKALKYSVRSEDIVCRFHGDEFGVWIESADLDILDWVIARLDNNLTACIPYSFGVSLQASDYEAAIAEADTNMFNQKLQKGLENV